MAHGPQFEFLPSCFSSTYEREKSKGRIEMKERLRWLGAGFIESFGRLPDRPALEIDGEVITYGDLHSRAASLSATLLNTTPSDGPALTAIFAYRSATAFVGVLAALFRGHGYVPLNPLFPPERTQTMVKRAGCRAVVIDSTGEKELDQVLKGIDEQLVLVFPERRDVADLVAREDRGTGFSGGFITPREFPSF